MRQSGTPGNQQLEVEYMMRNFWILLFLMLVLSNVPAAQPLPTPWFEDVKTSVAITPEAGCSLARALYDGLKNKTAPDKLARLAPPDNTPRALFITLSDGLFPSRTYFATGYNFRDALLTLLQIIDKREPEYAGAITGMLSAQVDLAKEEKRQPPSHVKEKLSRPTQWDRLQLDIVQASMPASGFRIGGSRLLLASAVGLAFDRGSSFAFTPEQLTGRCLLTSQRQLSTTNVANMISESTNWVAWKLWNEMAASETLFKVCLFESDSFYADREHQYALFRGRPVKFGGEAVDAREIANGAIPIARTVAAGLTPRCTYPAPFLEWVAQWDDGRLTSQEQSQLVETMLQCASLPEVDSKTRRELTAAAKCAGQSLLKMLKHYDADEIGLDEFPSKRRKTTQRTFAAVVEPEVLEDRGGGQLPRRLTLLKSNAAAYLAFAGLAESLPDNDDTGNDCHGKLKQLFAHILSQFLPDGQFISVLRYPELTPLLDCAPGGTEGAAIHSLAGLVIMRHLELFPQLGSSGKLQELLALIEKHLLTESLAGGKALEDLPLSAEVAQFLAMRARQAGKSRKAILAALTRLILASQHQLSLKPMLPDMFGAPDDIPSMTYAAQRMEVCALAADALARCGHADEARALLADSWPLWVFQQQAQMIPATASALPQPWQYLGYMRDNLADFGFTLDGMLAQCQSRIALAQALSHLKLPQFTPTPELQKRYDDAWERLRHRPICLAPELILPPIGNDGSGRKLSGRLDKPTVREQQLDGTVKFHQIAPDEGKASSRVLQKKRR